MDNVSKILKFINQEEPKQEEKQEELKQEEEKPKVEIWEDSKGYKSMISKMNRAKKYPIIINEKVFNSAEELEAFKNEIIDRRKRHLKGERQKKKENTKLNLEELPTISDTSELIEEDGFYYKKGSIEGISINDKIRKIPQTDAKDRAELIKQIKTNKQAMEKLTKTENEDDFKKESEEVFKESPIYQKHALNDLNKDNTWTRSGFYKYMLKVIDEEEKKSREKGESGRPPQIPKNKKKEQRKPLERQEEIPQISAARKIINRGRINPALLIKN